MQAAAPPPHQVHSMSPYEMVPWRQGPSTDRQEHVETVGNCLERRRMRSARKAASLDQFCLGRASSRLVAIDLRDPSEKSCVRTDVTS